jgi:hypothetical protein
MTIDKPITSGSQLSDEMYREMLEQECEGAISPAQEEVAALNAMSEDAMSRYQEVLEHGLNAQAVRLTPHMLREMGPHQRRQMLDFLVRRVELFEEKIRMISRSIVIGELVIPDHISERVA